MKVAVKRLHYQALRSKKDLDCFFKEAALMRRIQHRCTAPITCICCARNLPLNWNSLKSKEYDCQPDLSSFVYWETVKE